MNTYARPIRLLRFTLWALLLGLTLGPSVARATPLTPIGVVARASGSPTAGYSIVVTWLTPPNSPSPAAYNVYRSTTPGGAGLALYGSNSQYNSSNSFTDTSVDSGRTYYYTITQIDVNAGQESAMSTEVSATPGAAPLAAPVLSGSIGNSQATLTWSAVTGATFYNVYRANYNGSYALISSGVTVRTYVDTGVVNGQTYVYEVTPDNAGGESSVSNAYQITPGQTPALPAPPDFIATASGDPINGYTVTLNWTEPVVHAGYFNHLVYRGTASGGEAQVAYSDDTSDYYYYTQTAIFTDTGLVAGQTYYYRVSAVDVTGEGPKSLEVSVTVGAPSVGAPALSGTLGNGANSLSWTAVSGGGHPTIYDLYRPTPTAAPMACWSATFPPQATWMRRSRTARPTTTSSEPTTATARVRPPTPST